MAEIFIEQLDQQTPELEARLINKATDWYNLDSRNRLSRRAIHVPATVNHGKKITISFSGESDDLTWYFTETTREGSCTTQTTLVLPSKKQSYLSISQWDDFMGHMGMPQNYDAEQFHLERFNNLLSEAN